MYHAFFCMNANVSPNIWVFLWEINLASRERTSGKLSSINFTTAYARTEWDKIARFTMKFVSIQSMKTFFWRVEMCFVYKIIVISWNLIEWRISVSLGRIIICFHIPDTECFFTRVLCFCSSFLCVCFCCVALIVLSLVPALCNNIW